MSKWIIRALVIVALIAAAIVARFTVLAPKPIPVRVVVATLGRVEETITNSKAGTVRARRRSHLSPETGGRVVEITHREGDSVAPGELLLRLDDATQVAQTEHARRSLESAQARHEQMCVTAERNRREYERNKTLFAEKVISIDLLDEVESRFNVSVFACETAARNIETERASVALAEAELAKTRMLAPFGGILAEVAVEVGEWITPSPPMLQAPTVMDLLDPASIYVSAPMDEVDLALIRKGQSVRITVDSHRDRSFAGHVVRVAPYVLDIEEQNRTVEIEVEFDDADLAASLLPGTSADVEVLLKVNDSCLRVPTSALLRDDHVLVVTADETLVRRKIEAGLRNWEYVEVTSGLEHGDRVVVSLDRPDIRDGARIAVDSGDGAGP